MSKLLYPLRQNAQYPVSRSLGSIRTSLDAWRRATFIACARNQTTVSLLIQAMTESLYWLSYPSSYFQTEVLQSKTYTWFQLYGALLVRWFPFTQWHSFHCYVTEQLHVQTDVTYCFTEAEFHHMLLNYWPENNFNLTDLMVSAHSDLNWKSIMLTHCVETGCVSCMRQV